MNECCRCASPYFFSAQALVFVFVVHSGMSREKEKPTPVFEPGLKGVYATSSLQPLPQKEVFYPRRDHPNPMQKYDNISPTRQLLNKPPLEPIPRSSPTRHWDSPMRSRPSPSLDISDIAGTCPGSGAHSFTTKRQVDPQNPVYVWPSKPLVNIETTKFLRDAHSVADIEGASPRHHEREHLTMTNSLHGISGCSPKKQRPPRLSNLAVGDDVHDINASGHFVSQRVTDPLSPRYHMTADAGPTIGIKSYEYGKVDGSHPRIQPGVRSEVFQLCTSGIDGAQADTRLRSKKERLVNSILEGKSGLGASLPLRSTRDPVSPSKNEKQAPSPKSSGAKSPLVSSSLGAVSPSKALSAGGSRASPKGMSPKAAATPPLMSPVDVRLLAAFGN
jgi:hypothetical protein